MIIAYFIAYFWEIKAPQTSLHRYASDIISFDDLRGQFWPTWIDHKLQGIKERFCKGNIFYYFLKSCRNSDEHYFLICVFPRDWQIEISISFILWTIGKLLIFTLHLQLKKYTLSYGLCHPQLIIIVPRSSISFFTHHFKSLGETEDSKIVEGTGVCYSYF